MAMVEDVVRQLGRSRCGRVEMTQPCEHGDRYLVMFYVHEAADLFERLYRGASGVPLRRSATLPQGLRVVEVDASIIGLMVVATGEVMRRRNARLN